MLIKCIKGFMVDGGSDAILKGEMFEMVDDFDFKGTHHSRNPEMLISFSEEQLMNYFEFVA